MSGFESGIAIGNAFMQGRDRREGGRIYEQLSKSNAPELEPEFKRLLEIAPQKAKSLMDAAGVADASRMNAMLKDAKTAQYLLSNGDNEGAMQLLSNRAQEISRLGGSARETMEVYNAIRDGDPKSAIEMLKGFQDLFDPNAKQAAKPAPYQQAVGGMVFNPNNGTFIRSPEGEAMFAEIEERKNKTGKLDIKDRAAINKDVTGMLKDSTLIYNTAKDLVGLGDLGGGPSSIAMVFKFMKALDPNSVVKSDEFATAENSAGTPETIRNYYNKILSGEKLSPEQIKDFIATAKTLSNSASKSAADQVNNYMYTYEDMLGDEFQSRVMRRIPQQFEMPKPVQGNDLSGMTLDELKALKTKGGQ